MAESNLGLILLVVVVVLINIVGLGMVMSRRSGSDRKRIEELENQLADKEKELETYKSQVNDHFMKTSLLVTQMTDSYKAVFMHLVEGSQNLCSSDAALLRPGEGLSLVHDEKTPPEESEAVKDAPEAGEPGDEDVFTAEKKPEDQAGESVVPETPDQPDPEFDEGAGEYDSDQVDAESVLEKEVLIEQEILVESEAEGPQPGASENSGKPSHQGDSKQPAG